MEMDLAAVRKKNIRAVFGGTKASTSPSNLLFLFLSFSNIVILL